MNMLKLITSFALVNFLVFQSFCADYGCERRKSFGTLQAPRLATTTRSRSHGQLSNSGLLPAQGRWRLIREHSRELVRISNRRSADDGVVPLPPNAILGDVHRSADDKSGSMEIKGPLANALFTQSPDTTPGNVERTKHGKKRSLDYYQKLLRGRAAKELQPFLRNFYQAKFTDDEVKKVEDDLLLGFIQKISDGDYKEGVDGLRVMIHCSMKKKNSPFTRPQLEVVKLLFKDLNMNVFHLCSLFNQELDVPNALKLLEPFSDRGASAGAGAGIDG